VNCGAVSTIIGGKLDVVAAATMATGMYERRFRLTVQERARYHSVKAIAQIGRYSLKLRDREELDQGQPGGDRWRQLPLCGTGTR
jgi:hypothetical protein